MAEFAIFNWLISLVHGVSFRAEAELLAVETQQRRKRLSAVSVSTQDAQELESKALALNFKRLLLHLP